MAILFAIMSLHKGVEMKAWIICVLVYVFVIVCYATGMIKSKYATCDPTPEQCLSVCVEEFERMGC